MYARLFLAGLLCGALSFPGGDATAQGRYVPQGAAQRHFENGERLQRQGDDLRQDGDEAGALERYREAAEAFADAIDADPAYIEAYGRLGRVHYSTGDHSKALPTLERGLQREKGNQDLNFWYGQNLVGAGKVKEGLRALERVAAETDRFPEVYAVLGNQYYAKGDFARARPAFAQYLRLEPDATAARAKYGNTLFKLREYAKALAEFEAVRLQWPDNVLVWVNIGNCHYQLGAYPKAVETLREALERDPERQSVLFNLAQSYFQLEDYEAAVTYYRRFLGFKPESFNGHYFLGSALMALGDDAGALASLAKARELRPKIVHPIYKSALIHLAAGRTDAAAPFLSAAARLKPEDPWVLSAQGTLARQQGRLDEAAARHRGATERLPTNARLHANLALTELRARRTGAAGVAVERALKLDAEDEWVRGAAATVLASQAKAAAKGGDAKGADTLLSRAIGLRPGDARLLASRALVRLDAGLKTLALTDARAATKAAPKDALARYALGRALYAAGDLEAARDAFVTANSQQPMDSAVAGRGAAMLRLGAIDEATVVLEAAHKAAPDAKPIRLNRAAAHYHRAARRLAKGATARDAGDLKIALASEGDLKPLTAARVNYAALVVALRRGDGAEARQYLAALGRHAAALRKQKVRGRYLTRRTSPQHVEYLNAFTNALLKRYDRAYATVEGLRAAKKKRRPEAKLARWLLDRLGVAAFKAGRRKEAIERLAAAQRFGRDDATESNLLAARYPTRGQRYERRWRALARKVNEAAFNLGVVLDRAGKHEAAWKAYTRYAKTGGAYAKRAKEVADAKARIFGFGR